MGLMARVDRVGRLGGGVASVGGGGGGSGWSSVTLGMNGSKMCRGSVGGIGKSGL